MDFRNDLCYNDLVNDTELHHRSEGGIRMTYGKDILDLYERCERTDKDTVTRNMDFLFSVRGETKHSKYYSRSAVLSAVTATKQSTVYAWTCNGRYDIKIPFLKLCMISQAFDIPVDFLLSETQDWMTNELSVTINNKIKALEESLNEG